ncbi:unnamed protein product [Miscanthus lutarioriparius]|uniref:Uncharacterized protein n=1 Tax=Miscanthus lutarioriparius TaxID=422564 RepID=A0A811RQ02_9POAL|nr:unnamed protein product [Miscanthus lutarioriparius]
MTTTTLLCTATQLERRQHRARWPGPAPLAPLGLGPVSVLVVFLASWLTPPPSHTLSSPAPSTVAWAKLVHVTLVVAGAHLLASPPRALRRIHGEDRLRQLHARRLLALAAAVGDEAASLLAGALAVAVGARVGVRRRSPASGTRHAANQVRAIGDRGGSAPRIFVFGLTVPNGPVGVAIVEKVEDFVVGTLLPRFFVMSGLRTDTAKITKDTPRWCC